MSAGENRLRRRVRSRAASIIKSRASRIGVRLAQRLCLWICIFALGACGPSAPPAPPPADLVFLMRPGETTWFIDAEGKPAGIDYDLAQLFARKHGLKV